jgi:probable F420-dependent oxidoreductase
MLFTLAYPLQEPGSNALLAEPDAVVRIAQASEAAGFSAIAMTDHPAPSRKWLKHGGHTGFDPLAALSFCAAVTSTIRLMTYVLVLPYRNPLLAARSIATLDRLSSGRLDLAVAPGYLRSEFAALGTDYERRAEVFDEALDVMTRVFSDTSFRFEGGRFVARGVGIEPGPVQLPHPPLWIGGNGVRARRRAARLGAGWSPVQMSADKLQTTGSVAMPSTDHLRSAIADLKKRVREAGRPDGSVKVQLKSLVASDIDAEASWFRDRVTELEDAGVDQLVLRAPANDLDQSVAAIEAFGESVIARQSAQRGAGKI